MLVLNLFATLHDSKQEGEFKLQCSEGTNTEHVIQVSEIMGNQRKQSLAS